MCCTRVDIRNREHSSHHSRGLEYVCVEPLRAFLVKAPILVECREEEGRYCLFSENLSG